MRCRSSLTKTRCDPRQRVSTQPSRLSAARTRAALGTWREGTGRDQFRAARAQRPGSALAETVLHDRTAVSGGRTDKSGQGRGRTAGLPSFKTTVMRSYALATGQELG